MEGKIIEQEENNPDPTSPALSGTRYQTILEYTGSATAIIEENDTLTYVNPEFEKIIGYVREEIIGRRRWAEFIVPEDIPLMNAYRLRRKTDPESQPAGHEFRFIRWDGQVRNGFIAINAIPDTSKCVASILDITDKIRAEEAMVRANKKLNFFSKVTRHDILNQLTVLKGYLSLEKEMTENPAALATIQKELQAVDAIQAQILFTRDYQDIGVNPPEWQDVRSIISRALSGIPSRPIPVAIDIPRVLVYADVHLEKVFFHLLQNALKYGKKATQIHLRGQESFDEFVLICEDDGVGIPVDAKEKIFTREFYQSTGLDMYLSREILSITGLTIHETGVFGKGARFEIRIPNGSYRFSA